VKIVSRQKKTAENIPVAWSEDQVERIIRRYLGRSAATKAAIRQLNEVRKGT
jgi:hypothetical protein